MQNLQITMLSGYNKLINISKTSNVFELLDILDINELNCRIINKRTNKQLSNDYSKTLEDCNIKPNDILVIIYRLGPLLSKTTIEACYMAKEQNKLPLRFI